MTMTSKVAASTLSRLLGPGLCAIALLAASQAGAATSDPAHDFLPTFGGSITSTDLDVVSASVTYNQATDTFVLSSTMDGPIGTTPTALYVWGVNRGAGTAGFASSGLDGVLFDRVILLRADGTGTVVGAGNLPAGSITVSGNTITGVVSGASLPSTGFDKLGYTWNLWPRDTSVGSNFAAISDFAPDNSNLLTTAVPEPSIQALVLVGLGGLGMLGYQRQRSR